MLEIGVVHPGQVSLGPVKSPPHAQMDKEKDYQGSGKREAESDAAKESKQSVGDFHRRDLLNLQAVFAGQIIYILCRIH